VITQVATLMTTTYDGFNDVHLTEKLQERHALPISRATVRRLRVALGRPPLWGALQDRLSVAAGGGGRNRRGGVAAYLTTSRQERRGLIVRFGHHLATVRGADRHPDATVVLVADTAELPEGGNLVAIPHLVASTTETGIKDAVVWEWASPAILDAWRPGRCFDLATWQTRVGRLVRLKGALRRGAVDPVRHDELLGRLEGRYLSFRFVVENEELVAAAIDDFDLVDQADPPRP
jgi:hypothetical protein